MLREFHRLRVRGYRIIFAYKTTPKQRVIRCIFAGRRNAVYEIFEEALKKQLLSGNAE